MTTYTVFRSNDSTKATSRLTLEEAAHELLTYDGHDYEIREGGISQWSGQPSMACQKPKSIGR